MKVFTIPANTFGLVVIVAWIGFLAHKPLLQIYDDRTTPQPWFAASIDIPDHPVGENATVRYNRIINRPLSGNWQASVFRYSSQDSFEYVCSGDGYARYFPDTSGEISMALSEFVGAECIESEGRYRVCASYALENANGLLRTFGPVCETFLVTRNSEGQ